MKYPRVSSVLATRVASAISTVITKAVRIHVKLNFTLVVYLTSFELCDICVISIMTRESMLVQISRMLYYTVILYHSPIWNSGGICDDVLGFIRQTELVLVLWYMCKA